MIVHRGGAVRSEIQRGQQGRRGARAQRRAGQWNAVEPAVKFSGGTPAGVARGVCYFAGVGADDGALAFDEAHGVVHVLDDLHGFESDHAEIETDRRRRVRDAPDGGVAREVEPMVVAAQIVAAVEFDALVVGIDSAEIEG